MKNIRSYIRNILLEMSDASMFHPKLQQGIATMREKGIYFIDDSGGNYIELYLHDGNRDRGRFIAYLGVDQKAYSGEPLCMITDTHIDEDLRKTGIGPLFYEYIADRVYPAYIINDRGHTSDKAARMYRYFHRNTDDYDRIQLDITSENWEDTHVLTPERWDDVSMESFFDKEYKDKPKNMVKNFSNYPDIKKKLLASPFSKAYRRKKPSGISDWMDENLLNPDESMFD